MIELGSRRHTGATHLSLLVATILLFDCDQEPQTPSLPTHVRHERRKRLE